MGWIGGIVGRFRQRGKAAFVCSTECRCACRIKQFAFFFRKIFAPYCQNPPKQHNPASVGLPGDAPGNAALTNTFDRKLTMLVHRKLAILLLFAVMAVPGNVSAGLVINGSFETINGAQLSKLGDSGAPYSSPQGWTIGHGGGGPGSVGFVFDQNADNSVPPGGSLDPGGSTKYLWGPDYNILPGPFNNGFAGTPDGANFIGLMSDPGDGLQQSLTGLTIGNLYEVSFLMAGAQTTDSTGDTTQKLDVYFGSSVKTSAELLTPSTGYTDWTPQSLTFTAGTSNLQLAFKAVGTGPGSVVLLDGVSVTSLTQPVPEPATMGVAAFTAVGMGISHLRRRRQAKVAEGSGDSAGV